SPPLSSSKTGRKRGGSPAETPKRANRSRRFWSKWPSESGIGFFFFGRLETIGPWVSILLGTEVDPQWIAKGRVSIDGAKSVRRHHHRSGTCRNDRSRLRRTSQPGYPHAGTGCARGTDGQYRGNRELSRL